MYNFLCSKDCNLKIDFKNVPIEGKFKQDIFLQNSGKTTESDHQSRYSSPVLRLLTPINMIQLHQMLELWILQQPAMQTDSEIGSFLTVHLGLDASGFTQKTLDQFKE